MLSLTWEVHSEPMSLGEWRSTCLPISMNTFEIPCLLSMVSTGLCGKDVIITSEVSAAPPTRSGGIDVIITSEVSAAPPTRLGGIDVIMTSEVSAAPPTRSGGIDVIAVELDTCAGTEDWSWLLREVVGPSPLPLASHWQGGAAWVGWGPDLLLLDLLQSSFRTSASD